MDTYKDVFYAAGLPALISTGITLVYFLLKAYQFAVHAVSHQTGGRLAAATPGGHQQENSPTRRPHPTGAVAPTCRHDYGLVNAIPAGYESDDSWDNLSHNHEHTHMHNIVPLLTLRPWCNSSCRGPEQQQFREQSVTNV